MNTLSPAEKVVFALVEEGKTTTEIAALRGRSVHTVGNQLASIYRKLGVKSRTCAVAQGRSDEGVRKTLEARGFPDRVVETGCLLVLGHSNAQIAKSTGVSKSTTALAIARLCRAFEARGRVDLVRVLTTPA